MTKVRAVGQAARIYIGEADKIKGKLLFEVIVRTASRCRRDVEPFQGKDCQVIELCIAVAVHVAGENAARPSR